ncbi:MAG: hypothetical protein J6Y02_01100 [Pseudobutyrivibrio sp.]|nr:hypothetical protein [Pseudobutyrivibrio sp.]
MSDNTNYVNREPVYISNSKFIFQTNFSGDPKKDKYGSNTRRGNLIIPTEEQAQEMIDMGYNDRATRPRSEEEEEGFVPTYFIPITVGYNHPRKKPKVVLVTNGVAQELDEENVGTIDNVYVLNVNATLNPRYNQDRDSFTMYVSQLYVEQDVEDDPWADQYSWNTANE